MDEKQRQIMDAMHRFRDRGIHSVSVRDLKIATGDESEIKEGDEDQFIHLTSKGIGERTQ